VHETDVHVPVLFQIVTTPAEEAAKKVELFLAGMVDTVSAKMQSQQRLSARIGLDQVVKAVDQSAQNCFAADLRKKSVLGNWFHMRQDCGRVFLGS